jgi:type IV pilus assembly protein PilM
VAKTRIGLDIGSTAVRAAEVTLGGTPTLIKAAQVPVPPGAVENGEIRDPAAVAEAIKVLWSSDGGNFKGRQVWMGVGNQRVVVREIALPWLPEKELRASLGFQVQDFIPMPVDEAVLDFDPLGEFEQDGRKMLRMLLVAAQKVMVDAMVQAALDAKLEPVGIDLVPFALVRAVGTSDAGMDLEETGDEAIIDVGSHVTNIVVHARGTTRFVRILPSGGRDVTLAIARGLGVEDDVAERLKRGEFGEEGTPPASPVGGAPPRADQHETGQSVTEPPASDAGDTEEPEGERPEGMPSREQVRQVAMTRAAAFVDEIRSSLEFYTAQAQGARIGRVIITGGGSKLDGFLDLLRERIPVDVEAGHVFQRVTSQLSLTPQAAADAEPVLAVAVGLAIPGRAG